MRVATVTFIDRLPILMTPRSLVELDGFYCSTVLSSTKSWMGRIEPGNDGDKLLYRTSEGRPDFSLIVPPPLADSVNRWEIGSTRREPEHDFNGVSFVLPGLELFES